jgi:N utilization substance protein B
LALQGLCCLDVQGHGALDLVRRFLDESAELPVVTSAAHKLLADTLACRDDCDGLIARHAKHWDLSRLALVDRNILRLAVCELRGEKTPPKVVITEAIHLAREFSTAESPRFVNGVLDAVMKELQGDVSPVTGSDEAVTSNSELETPNSDSSNPQSTIRNPQ